MKKLNTQQNIIVSLLNNALTAQGHADQITSLSGANADIIAKVIKVAADWEPMRKEYTAAYEVRMISSGLWSPIREPEALKLPATERTDAQKMEVAGFKDLTHKRMQSASKSWNRYVVAPALKKYGDTLPAPPTKSRGTQSRTSPEREAFVIQRDDIAAWTDRTHSAETRYERMKFLHWCMVNMNTIADAIDSGLFKVARKAA